MSFRLNNDISYGSYMPLDAAMLKTSRNMASFRQQGTANKQKGPTYVSSMLLKLHDSYPAACF
jgi:hypothetical protein